MRDEIKLILPTSWQPDRNEFLSALGISPGGLGELFFGSVYDAFFVTSIEVKSEFKKYYSVEYSSVADYLEIRHGESVSDDELEANFVFLITWLPQVVDDVYEESRLDTVLRCIRKLEEAHFEGEA